MITLQAIRIDQSYDLTGTTRALLQNYVVILLPNGHEIRAALSDEDVRSILHQVPVGDVQEKPVRTPRHAPAPEPEPAPEPVEMEPAPEEGLTQEEAENTPIPWNELDDSILAPMMKAAFFKLKAPMMLSPKAIMALVDDISSKFTAEDWREVTGQEVAVEEPPAPQPQRAPVRRMQWADGSPMMPGSVMGRTVPKDDMGYPVVEGEVDPGEVVGRGSEVDEDGVGQL